MKMIGVGIAWLMWMGLGGGVGWVGGGGGGGCGGGGGGVGGGGASYARLQLLIPRAIGEDCPIGGAGDTCFY